MSDKKVQWHPGFVAAMSLELAESRGGLVFEKEYNLNTKPLEIDLLVIKKEATVRVGNEIGAFFRGHNIMEYKSPEGLFRYFAKHGHPVSSRGRGIYAVGGNAPFPTQIVVTGELDKAEHVWLGSLSEKLGKQDLRGLLEKVRQLSGKADRELADAVLEVSIGANRQAVEELKGDEEIARH